MIREDRELLAELARLNRGMASFCLRIMDGSASVTKQLDYAQRMIAAGERLRRRGEGIGEIVGTVVTIIEGEVLGNGLSRIFPERRAKPYRDGTS